MSKMNFDSLKNINVPEEWIENAIGIPETTKGKNTLFKISRVISVAACFIVVCVLSVSTFFLIENNKGEFASTNSTPSEVSSYSKNTQVTYSKKNSENTDPSSQPDTKNDDVFLQKNTENIPSDKITENDTTEATEKLETYLPEITEETKPVVNNTPSVSTESTTLSTEENSMPSETEESSESTAKVPSTSEKATDAKVDSGSVTTTSAPVCSGKISKKDIVGKGRIYCRIYDKKGNLLGDENLYARSHLVRTKIEMEKHVRVVYDPMGAKLGLKQGRYTYIFYNEKGKDVASGKFKV